MQTIRQSPNFFDNHHVYMTIIKRTTQSSRSIDKHHGSTTITSFIQHSPRLHDNHHVYMQKLTELVSR